MFLYAKRHKLNSKQNQKNQNVLCLVVGFKDFHYAIYDKERMKIFTVELGVFVPYPEEGKDAKDHRRPSIL